ncbi:putative phospholipid-transporting ATPase VB [Platysternon megacephalum]|uniref:CD44 antigen n=1 Tax=Platysternon megacephalum TaxID=55544 RepID=A0A4D9EJ93_9SAUR|nr:putative phospholipid-transporting ATPase VB [Platysternon megacephalum]
MKRGHELNGPWRLSCTLILTAVVVSPDQNRSMLAEEFNISCRYAGVFHVEKNRRYSLTRDEAVELCKALNSTLPTMDQMKKAHGLGFETCRYGYIEDKIVIPRIKPYFLCAANNTGIYILTSNVTDRYDTYCYNASETRETACEPIIRLDVSRPDNQSQIVIDNADGSRYTDGVKHTDPTPVTDDNHVGSGSIHDGDATNPTIIGTHTPGTPYYEETTPDALSTDYSSGSGRKEDHPTSTNDIVIPFDDKPGEDSTMISLITDGVPGKDHPSKGRHPTSTTYEDSYHGNSTQGQQMPGFIPSWQHSADHKEEHPSAAGQADEDSQENITRDEDSRQSHLNRGSLPEGDNNVAKEGHPTSTSVDRHHYTHHETTTQAKPFFPPWWHSVNSKEQHPTTASNAVKPVHEETSTQPHWNQFADSWWWWSHPDHKEQQPTQATGDLSSHDDGADGEDSTQDPLIPVISLGGDNSEDKEQHPPSSTVNPHHGAHEETSTQHEGNPSPDIWWGSTTDHKEQHPTTATKDKDSQEYETDDEDSLQDPLPSGWDTNDDTEQHPPVTNVDSHGDPKRIGSTQDPLLHNVYLGVDKEEDKYPTNTTVDSVKPAHFPAKERDHSSSSMTVNNEIGHNTYTPTVVVSNEGAKNEDATQDPLLHNVYLGVDKEEDKYPTNTTVDSVKPAHFPAKERDHSSSSMTVNNETGRNIYTPTGAKNEDPTQDPLLNGAHPGWSDKFMYSTNTTRDDVLPGVIPSRGSEHSTTAMVSNGGAKHEDSTQDPLLHTVHPGWGNADKYPTNVTRDDVLPGIIPPSENDQEKESSHTAVTSNDGAIYEDSTHESLPSDNQPGWGSEDKYPTNTSRDYVIPGLIPENEDESYTAVVSNDGATHEDSTQDPLLHSVHPGWGNEDKYLTATSRDDVLPGIIPPSETEHKNESSHTAVVSNDGIKHEDSTKDPLAPGIQPGGDNEDKYPTNSPIDALIPGVLSDIESGHGRGPASTATSKNKWLIIVASLLALTLILAVCIAVNSRSRCGQKKKLVINNGKGSVSDKKMGGLNGEASKSQEMVHLVHKEQPDNRTGSCDEFLTTDETKNQQEANMKTGM